MRATKEMNKNQMCVGARLRPCPNNRGITLIALIITIIVMLILVAVTISMAVNGGLFDYAGKAVGDTQNAIDAEQELGSGKVQIDGVWYDSIDDYLDGKQSIGTGEGEGGAEGGLQIELSIAGEKVLTVPVPTGFRHKEGTIDTGYVIVNETDGNEFVWVPVDKNQKITLKITSDNDIKGVFLYDPNHEPILEIVDDESLEKTYYNTDIMPTINGLYTAYIETEDGTTTQRLFVKSLYTRDSFADWYISDECTSYPSIPGKFGVTYSNKKEFGTAVAEAMGFESLDDAYQEGFGIDELISLFVTFNYGDGYGYDMEGIEAYAENVNKNGGFYIGRYEAGISTWDTNAGLGDEIPGSKAGYYTVSPSFEEARECAEKLYSSSEFTVGLPTDAAWDRTLRWFHETGAKTLKEIAGDSKDWGNYLDSEFEITRGEYSELENISYNEFIEVSDKYKKEKDKEVLLTTGATERNCANNIYDFAGNVLEWTNSQMTWNSVVYGSNRGGINSDTGSNGAALYYGFTEKSISYLNYGFRYALYLN